MCDIIYFKKFRTFRTTNFFILFRWIFFRYSSFSFCTFERRRRPPKTITVVFVCVCVYLYLLLVGCFLFNGIGAFISLLSCFQPFSFTVRDIQTRALSAFKHPERCTISLIFMLRSQPETSLGKRIHQCNLKESISNDKLKVIFMCVEHIPKLKYITTATSLSSVIQINEVVV